MTPQLACLIDVGVLARAEGARQAKDFDQLARDATRRGELTEGQAEALAGLLGLQPSRPQNDR